MKANTLIMLAAVFTTGTFASTVLSQDEAEAFCGELGVMNVTDLPEDVDPNAVRTCLEHPLSALDGELEKRDESLQKRGCWYGGAAIGCTRGYCWKPCAQPGSGQWCWTAKDNGFGNWLRCKVPSDCPISGQCGAGDCKKCGCSC